MIPRVVIVLVILCGRGFTTGEVKYYYYASPAAPVVQLQEARISTNNIDNTKQLKVICHGATANINVDWYAPLINAYLVKGHQVVAVDWGTLAHSPEVVSSIDKVGDNIGTYLISIHYAYNFPLDKIHFVGHSLGAHIGGYAGRLVIQILGSKVGRLTGIDPGTDLTLNLFGRKVMTKNDASFVDVIHTMAGTGGIGYSVGTADFYPNGGVYQPGCVVLDPACSHSRAPWLFIESINSNDFVAKQCDSWIQYKIGLCNRNSMAIMGEGCSLSASGDYHLSTNDKSPYARGR